MNQMSRPVVLKQEGYSTGGTATLARQNGPASLTVGVRGQLAMYMMHRTVSTGCSSGSTLAESQ